MVFAIAVFLSLCIWCYLALGRGGFWRNAERDDVTPPTPPAWPTVAVVIPARDEAEGIGACVASLLRQDYPGAWSVFLVDDDSSDGTADIARQAARECGAEHRLTVISGAPLPPGWTGKLWALDQGIAAATAVDPPPDYLLLTDADIVYQPGVLEWLAGTAVARGAALVSFMVKLRCRSFAERCFIPAFLFFFQMLYPFAWVNDPRRSTAAAAGGCMLIRTTALREAGGIGAIRNALIDDCTLAALLKRKGPIWLGLTEQVASIRGYPDWREIRRMVSRSAYAQLRYSPLILAGTVMAMAVVFLVPPVGTFSPFWLVSVAGLAAWLMMAMLFRPTLRLYGLSGLWGVALPAIAFAYLLFTIDSAVQSMRGKGGLWKGRFQAAKAN